MAKISTLEMECVVAQWLSPRRNLIVPNVSWGMGLHECDLVVLTNSGYLWEVEIKISKADLKKDQEKRHEHRNAKIKRLYFAIPDYLDNDDCIAMIPEHAGILIVATGRWRGRGWRAVEKRREAPNNGGYKLSDRERQSLTRLGALRIWGLKRKLLKKSADDVGQETHETKESDGIRAKYHDLVYQVATKHPGETRHDTAKRYIQQAEQSGSETACGSARGDSVQLRDHREGSAENQRD